MHWTEPATAEDSHAELEKRLWDAANKLWADASLKPSEFSPIVLGLIFLRYAETRFVAVHEEIGSSSSRRKVGPADYHAKGVIFLPEQARFGHLLQLPEGSELGKAVNDAMKAIEKENPDLADVLPKSYQILENRTLAEWLKFLDARHIFRQLDRAHRDFTPTQLEFLANVVRFYRDEDLELEHGSEAKWEEVFGNAVEYADVPGLCKAATRAEIEAQGWSLNPGRYVGVAVGEDLSDEDFKERLEALNEELEVLNVEARELETRIAENVTEILETS